MSDVDEEMGEAPDLADAMTFTTQSKGKSSAANLPVEAEDTLPWVEKYRPNTLEDVSGHKDIITTINKFVEKNRLPHLLLYGPPGTGKTSTVLALARRIYGPKNMRQMVLELNASDDRGIDVVREQIKTFSSTKQIFNSFKTSNEPNMATYKLIILDEADSMTSVAQMALRRIMEKYTPNTRFCILANYTHKLSPALLSRCTRFRFSPLPAPAIRHLVDIVIEREAVKIEPSAVDSLVKLSRGDMRRALNVLQACHASTLPMPSELEAANGDAMDVEKAREMISEATIYDCIASPHPGDISQVVETLLGTPDVRSCVTTLARIKQARGLALGDVITSVSERLADMDVPGPTRVRWCEGLAEVEWRLAGGGSEALQMSALVGVIREGVELMDKKR